MPAEKTTRAQGQAALAVGVFVALVATTLPVMRVIAPDAWVVAGFGLAAVDPGPRRGAAPGRCRGARGHRH